MADFWIGDWVRNMHTGRIGTYEGENNKPGSKNKNKVRVKIDGRIFLIPVNRLQLLSEKEVEAYRINKHTEPYNPKKKSSGFPEDVFKDTIDLHIEILAPHLAGKQVELILQKQIDSAREFIQKAIARRRLTITIIHGKGTGALKMEIDHLLDNYPQVFYKKEVNNGGAVEVLFKYI